GIGLSARLRAIRRVISADTATTERRKDNAPALSTNAALLRRRAHAKAAMQPDRRLISTNLNGGSPRRGPAMKTGARRYLEGKNFMNRIVFGGALSALLALGFASGANAQPVERDGSVFHKAVCGRVAGLMTRCHAHV